MKRIPLEKVFDPHKVEEKWYRFWEEKGYFRADEEGSKRAYSIVIPPPNITGSLHMGHALNNTLQDICVRYKRMDGNNVLWMPGTDHAGIATQNVVEKQLAIEGTSRHELGREKFIERVWQWREEYGRLIIKQLKKLGASCDWSRERFTMDEGLSKAVREVFVRLFEKGLIYKGDYIINWCPRCTTALSDLEVDHQDTDSNLYYIKYPLEEGTGYVIVATTRPETMLGDTAVAVHPLDPHYKKLVGKQCILPLMNRRIPIIDDNYVDIEFGTGALKITPAHDPNDFEIGRNHNLEIIRVIDDEARMNEQAGSYKGLDRFECRNKILEDLKYQGLLDKVETYQHAIGHCQRCRTIIEPTLSKQWFVKVKPLAEKAIEAVERGWTRIIPPKWENDYFEWMCNIKDWCISRQIWWGHRIPAWYCDLCNQMIVAIREPEVCNSCGNSSFNQETDVLDTWFSSALWPFSTMGWPNNTKELRLFYPTSLLVTGFDILTFWVARMMMMGLEFMGEVPFRDVYIHALVRDIEGQKMSKSKGNVIDPVDVIDQYGVDAFRFALAAFAAQGRDIKLSLERIEGYRNFANKIWNASRFIQMNLEGYDPARDNINNYQLALVGRWIRSELTKTVQGVRKGIDEYKFNEGASILYQFIWHKFCDWYLELIKPDLYQPESYNKSQTQSVMLHILETILRLLHPFMPFLSEEIWQSLPGTQGSIMISNFPNENENPLDPEAEGQMELLMGIISNIRSMRGEMNISPSKRIDVIVKCKREGELKLVLAHQRDIKRLAKVADLSLDTHLERPEGSAYAVVRDIEIFIPMKGIIDVEQEKIRLKKEIDKVTKEVALSKKKLENESFLRNAPAGIVKKERNKEKDLLEKQSKLMAGLSKLQKI